MGVGDLEERIIIEGVELKFELYDEAWSII